MLIVISKFALRLLHSCQKVFGIPANYHRHVQKRLRCKQERPAEWLAEHPAAAPATLDAVHQVLALQGEGLTKGQWRQGGFVPNWIAVETLASRLGCVARLGDPSDRTHEVPFWLRS